MTTSTETGGHGSPEALSEEELRVQLVDISQYRRELARDHADRVLAEKLGQGGFRGALNRVWYGAMGVGEGVRAKAYKEGLEQIGSSDDLFVLEGEDISSEESIKATLERFDQNLVDNYETADGTSREKRGVLEAGNEQHDNIRQGIKQLLEQYVNGEIDDANFAEEKNQFLRGISGGNADLFGAGAMYADNLFDVAQTIKQSSEHRANLDRIVEQMTVVTGEANRGIRSEADLSRIERIVENAGNSKLFSAGTAALIAGGTAGLFKATTSGGIRAAAAVTGIGLAAAGGIAAVRERTRLKHDRARSQREQAQGKVIEVTDAEIEAMPDDTMRQKMQKRAARKQRERRLKIEATTYEMVAAADVTDAVNSYVDPSTGELFLETPEEFSDALNTLVQAEGMAAIGATKNIDLIKFSSLDSVESERLHMLMATSTLKARLRELYEARNPDAGIDFDAYFETQIQAYIETVAGAEGEMSQKDKLFRELRAKEGAKAFGKGAALGFGVGTAFQEAAALLQNGGQFVGNVTGLAEGAPEPGESANDTLLRGMLDGTEFTPVEEVSEEVAEVATAEASVEAAMYSYEPSELLTLDLEEGMHVEQVGPEQSNVFRVYSGEGADRELVGEIVLNEHGEITEESLAALEEAGAIASVEHVPYETLSGENAGYDYGENHKVVFPEEYTVETTGDTQLTVTDSHGDQLAVIELDPATGAPTDESMVALADSGVEVTYSTEAVTGDPETVTVPLHEYLNNHAGESTEVTRTLWYGNDTPSPVFDLNELQTHAGGVNETWFDAEGNVVIDISGMTDTGSFQGGEVANVSQLVEDGELKAAISVSRDTQAEVFTFDINYDPATGRTTAVIDGDHGIASLFETTENGGRLFNGGFIEIMELTGETSDTGAEEVRILSTFVGENNAGEITETIIGQDPATTINIGPSGELLNDTTIDFEGLGPETEPGLDPEAVPTPEGEPTPDTPDVIPVATTEQLGGNEVNPVFPFFISPTRGMESRVFKRNTPERAGYYGGLDSAEVNRERRADRSPRLRFSSTADLETGVEVRYYRGLLERRRGRERVETVDEDIENSDVLKAIDSNTKAIVTIPAQAVSEADNMYNLLSLYGEQGGGAVEETVVLLHLNWTEANMANPDDVAKIDKARSEIARAQADFPDLKVAVIESEIPQSLIDAGNGVIGEVARRLYDTAILSVDRAVQDGRLESTDDVIMIRSDADVRGMDRNFLRKHIDRAAENPEADAFVGSVRWDSSLASRFPGYTISTHFYNAAIAYLGREKSTGADDETDDELAERNAGRGPATGGTNASIRISSLAAVGSVGFGEYLGAGSDDVEFGKRIKMARRRRKEGAGDVSSTPYGDLRHYYRPDEEPSRGRTIMPVLGAQVDSEGDRVFDNYIQEKGISSTWSNFDRKGYNEEFITADEAEPEMVNNRVVNIDTVAHRIELNIEDLCTRWFKDDSSVRSVMAIMFGKEDRAGNSLYTYGRDPDGKARFAFTDEGKVWLKNRIERDSRGRFNNIGGRLRRNLYNDARGSTITPVRAQPRFVGEPGR